MPYLPYVLTAVTSASCAALAALWLSKPAPLEATTIPPQIVDVEQSGVVVWGGWKTIDGYEAPGTTAVEIRCQRGQGKCSEAVATVFHHADGEDLEAQVFNYQVVNWDETGIEAVATAAMGECLDRRLSINLQQKTAALNWLPSEGCEGDTGHAELIGSPL